MSAAPAALPATDLLGRWDAAVCARENHIAICDAEGAYSYRQLDNITNKIAAALVDRGICAERIVGLDFYRSLDSVTGMLSVLKAGGAFMIPDRRLDVQYGDLPAKLWLVRRDTIDQNPRHRSMILNIGDIDLLSLPAIPWHSRLIADRQLAYVLFTSGSSGRPKGVLIERRNLSQFISAVTERLQLGPMDRWLQIAPPSFDVFLEETLPLLAAGGTVICGSRATDLSRFHCQLVDFSATVVEMTTALWREYLLFLISRQLVPPECLRFVIVGGEAMDGYSYEEWQRRFTTPLIHVYGITETTVSSTMYGGRVSPGDAEVALGAPLSGCSVTLRRDPDTEGDGEGGEIYIGGGCVGRGYLNDPALTASRFLPDAFGSPQSRVYLTGDRGVRREDGELLFRGRTDHQVKIRGHRVDLAGVELVLRENPLVGDAFVMIDPVTRTSLTAVVVLNASVWADGESRLVDREQSRLLQDGLAKRLPDYSIPSRYVEVANLPKTVRGKVDRQKLAGMIPSGPQREHACLDPVTQRVLDAFRSGLGLLGLGPDDNFFDFGGDSLNALTVMEALGNKQLSTATIFDYPTAREMARFLGAPD